MVDRRADLFGETDRLALQVVAVERLVVDALVAFDLNERP